MIDIPNDAPLDEGQRKQLDAVLGGLNADQLSWLGSFVSGQFSATGSAEALTVLYGTESGNCEELASQLSKQAKQKGYKPRLLNMADASLADLEGCAKLLVVVSTWGDGEPPETAEPFYKELMSAEVALKDTAFSVCALGDTSYDLFCHTGAVGQPRDGDWRASYCIYDTDRKTIYFRRVEYDIQTTQQKIIAAGLPQFLAERLAQGR